MQSVRLVVFNDETELDTVLERERVLLGRIVVEAMILFESDHTIPTSRVETVDERKILFDTSIDKRSVNVSGRGVM